MHKFECAGPPEIPMPRIKKFLFFFALKSANESCYSGKPRGSKENAG